MHLSYTEFKGKTIADKVDFICARKEVDKSQGLVIGTWSDGVEPMYIVTTESGTVKFEPIDARMPSYSYKEGSLKDALNMFIFNILEVKVPDALKGVLFNGTRGLTQFLVNEDCHCYFIPVMAKQMSILTALEMLMLSAEKLGLDLSIQSGHYLSGKITPNPVNGNKLNISGISVYKMDLISSLRSKSDISITLTSKTNNSCRYN